MRCKDVDTLPQVKENNRMTSEDVGNGAVSMPLQLSLMPIACSTMLHSWARLGGGWQNPSNTPISMR